MQFEAILKKLIMCMLTVIGTGFICYSDTCERVKENCHHDHWFLGRIEVGVFVMIFAVAWERYEFSNWFL